jgi:PAS domain S-box-containing protein
MLARCIFFLGRLQRKIKERATKDLSALTLAQFGLRLRICVLLFLTLLPAFILIVHNAAEENRRVKIEAEITAIRLVRLAAESHKQLVEDANDILTFLSRLPPSMLRPPACIDFFKKLPPRYPTFANMTVISPEGDLLCSFLPAPRGINFTDRPWFQQALRSRMFTVSEYLVGRITAKPSVIFALPALDDAGKVRAILGTSLPIDSLNRFIEPAQLPAGSTVTVIDKNGTILDQQPDREQWIGKRYPQAKVVRSLLTEKPDGGIATNGIEGIERLYAFAPVSSNPGVEAWTLAIGIPKDAAYAHVQLVFWQNILWITLMTIFVLTTAWIGSQRLIVRRMRVLADASTRLGTGDLTTRTGMAQERDELGQLSAAFDRMAEALQTREHDRQRAEQSRAQLAAIVESSDDAIVGRTLDGIVTSWNHGAETLFGYTKNEMIGHLIMILAPGNDIEKVEQNFERIRRGERIDSYEAVRIRKDGKPIHVSVTVSPVIDDNGKIIGASSIARDISERKRAEGEVKALHELNLSITSTLNLYPILDSLLEKLEILFPYASSHIRLINKSTGELERIACRNIDEARWKARARGNQQSVPKIILESKKPLAVRDLQSDERIQHREFYVQQGLISFLGVPLIVREEAIGVLALLTKEEHDFTQDEIRFTELLAQQASIAIYNSQLYEESMRTAEKLAEDEKQIRRLLVAQMNARDEEIKQIASVLHDDSSQLLAAVYIALDELAKELAPDKKQQIEQTKRLLDKIEHQLRNLSHELHPAMLDHLGLLPSLEFLTQQIARRSGIQVKLEGAMNGRLSPRLELALYRVAQEALANVTRNSQAKKVSIRMFEDESLVQCSIQDDGIGFDLQAILGRSKYDGHGLGLAIAHERLEAVGGTLQVHTAPGEGTKLYILIPKEEGNGGTAASR